MNLKFNLKNVIFFLTIVALLSPFFVDSQTYFPFIIGKATVFRLIVSLMSILGVIWFFANRDTRKPQRINWLVWAVIIFGILIFISAIFGVNFNRSFFSSNERMEGILGIWYFILFFLILATVFDRWDMEKIIKIEVAVSMAYSLMAILIYSGIWGVFPHLSGWRLAGYTGNPSYLAVYLLFNAFLALYCYFQQYYSDRKLFNWWLVPFLVQGLLVFATLTRGAMVGFLGGLIFIALGIVFLPRFLKNNAVDNIFKKASAVFLIIICAFSILIFIGKDTTFVQNNKILSRFSSISLSDPTARSRIFSIGTAWQSFLQKPWFGWGQDNYEAAYVENFNPLVLEYLPEDYYFDRAHNKPMEVLATNGIFGFLSYCSIFVLSFYFLYRLAKKNNWFLPSLALAGCLFGYFIQNILLFDIHESYLMLFLVLSLIALFSSVDSSQEGEKTNQDKKFSADTEEKKRFFAFSSKTGQAFVVVVVACLVVFSTIQWIIKPYWASKGIFRVNYLMMQGQGEDAFYELEKTIKNQSFFGEEIVIAVKKAYSSYAFKIDEKYRKEILEKLIILAQENNKIVPWRFSLVSAKLDIETMLSEWDKKWLLKSAESAEDMLSRFPHFPSAHLLAAKAFVLNEDIEKGIEEANKTIEIDSSIASSYYLLGVAYNELGETEKANENFIKAAELNYPYQDKSQILYVINLLITDGKYETIKNMYLKAIEIDPADVSLYTGLAATYGKLHNKVQAIEYANKAAELNPSIRESADVFIHLVENEQWNQISD